MQDQTQTPAASDEVDFTIIVPCLNEETRVVPTLRTIEAAMDAIGASYEVIVGDDGSTDQTAAVVEEFIKSNPHLPVRLYRNPYNLGMARTFVDLAFRGRGKYCRIVAGDDVEKKETITKICSVAGKADIIVPYHPEVEGKSFPRRIISRTYTTLVNWISGYSLIYYNGCPLYRRFHVMRWAPYNYGFSCQADLITTLLDQGATYLEIPVPATHQVKEKEVSALHFRNFVSAGHTLFEMMLRRIRRSLFESKKPRFPIPYE